MDIQLKPQPWYRKHFIHILTATAFAACAVWLIWLAVSPPLRQLDAGACQIAEAAEMPMLEYVDVEGVVQPIQTVRLNALEGGFVERIVAEEGAMLQAGDTILVLSNPELLRTIGEEQAEWERLQLNYREQEIEMEQRSLTLRQQALEADHQLTALEKTLRQSREECRMGIKSKAELEVMEEEYAYQCKRAALQRQSLRHDSAVTRLKREVVANSRMASERKMLRSESRISRLVVRATVAGQLSFLHVALGQQVGAGESLGEIKVLSDYKVHASLTEYYIDRITTGLPAHVLEEDEPFPLRISKVVPEVKDRTFDCDLVFTSAAPPHIRLGKSYRVQIALGRPEKALVIPRGDFLQLTGGRWIYRLAPDGRTARKVQIELGRQNPRQCEVVSGLQPGDRVIVSGYEKLGKAEELRIE